MKRKKNRISPTSVGHTSDPMKASEMILQVAGDLIALARDSHEKQNYLNLACTGWNLSLLTPEKRTMAIEQSIAAYRAFNPSATDDHCGSLRRNYEFIIEQKLKLYPSSRKTMVSASVQEVQGKHRINVVSYDPDRQ